MGEWNEGGEFRRPGNPVPREGRPHPSPQRSLVGRQPAEARLSACWRTIGTLAAAPPLILTRTRKRMALSPHPRLSIRLFGGTHRLQPHHLVDIELGAMKFSEMLRTPSTSPPDGAPAGSPARGAGPA